MIFDPTPTRLRKTDAILDQHRRFLLVVTDAVRDRAGVAWTPTRLHRLHQQPYHRLLRSLAEAVSGGKEVLAAAGGGRLRVSTHERHGVDGERSRSTGDLAARQPPISGNSVFPVSNIGESCGIARRGESPAFSDLTLPVSAALLQGIAASLSALTLRRVPRAN